MNTALLIAGVLMLLVVVAAGLEAYFRSQTKKPLSQSRPRRVAPRALGQDATTTSILQDLLDERQRLKEAKMQKEPRT